MSFKDDSFYCDNCGDDTFILNECERCGVILCDKCYDNNLGYCDDCKEILEEESRTMEEEMWREYFNSRF